MPGRAVPPAADEVIRRLLVTRLDSAFRLATFILHDPTGAEDAVQEAALLAWRGRGSLRDASSADGWFTRILVNVCRDELRRRERGPRVLTIDVFGDSQASAWGDQGELGSALARLTPDEQVIIALRFGRELTVPQLAAQLAIPEGTVKSRLHHALGHLRAALEAERRTAETS